MGWSDRIAHDHVRRLQSAGWLRRVAMTRGRGSLLVLTPAGAVIAGYPATRAPRSIGPTTWAHTSACAWTSAWLQLRRQTRWAADPRMEWWSERDVLADDFWRREVRYEDRRGSVRVTHRPDLGVRIGGRPVPVEVELHRKARSRLLGILRMYAELSAASDAPYGGVIYVTDNRDVTDALASAAADAGLSAPAFSIRALQDVVAQTREASTLLFARPNPITSGAAR